MEMRDMMLFIDADFISKKIVTWIQVNKKLEGMSK